MRKIPTVFRRDPADLSRVLPEVTPGCEWVLAGEGIATRKYDGTCVLIQRHGVFTRREVKPGKTPPPGFLTLETDPVTGKTVGWEPYHQSSWAKLIDDALVERGARLPAGTYELIGPKINGNPERVDRHTLVRHSDAETFGATGIPRIYDDLRALVLALGKQGWEGIVWHHPDGRMAKLKVRDFAKDPA